MIVVTYQAPSGLWSAAVPGVSIVCHAVSRDAAAIAIAAAVEGVDVEAALGSPVSSDEWRSALTASTVGALSDLRSEVDTLADAALASALTTKIDAVESIVRELHEHQAELVRLASEANTLERNRQAIIDRQHREAEAERIQKLQASNEARWVDVEVVQAPDGSVVMLKHFREFRGFVGQKRDPEFRRYSVQLGSWASAELAPADVQSRIGKPFKRSKAEVPVEIPHN